MVLEGRSSVGPFVLALEFSEVMGTVFAGKREAGRAELGEEGRSWGSGRRLSPATPALARLPPPLENILCQLPLTMWQHCLVRGGGYICGVLGGEGTARCQPQRAMPSCPSATGTAQSALPPSTPCRLLFASLTPSCPSGREQSPCLCPCQVLAEGGGGDRKP